jgi:hypothetical protein
MPDGLERLSTDNQLGFVLVSVLAGDQDVVACVAEIANIGEYFAYRLTVELLRGACVGPRDCRLAELLFGQRNL